MIYSSSFSAGLRPDPLLKVSEWANEYRVLSQTASQENGELRDLKWILYPLVEKVIFMKGEQIGGPVIGYIIDQTPGPMPANC